MRWKFPRGADSRQSAFWPVSRCCNNGKVGLSVDAVYVFDPVSFLLLIMLRNAIPVDPEIIQSKLLSNFHCVLDGLWERTHLLLVGDGEVRRGSPYVGECGVLFTLPRSNISGADI